jgi:quercetin dioxygenase-like cupin family protein
VTVNDRAFVRAHGEGFSVENPVGGVLTFAITGDESAGAMTVIETIAAPGEGPPLHVHEQDEFIRVLDGLFRVRLGDLLHEARAGAFVFIPRDVPHTWQNVGDTQARFVAAVIPAAPAFEEFFARFAELPANERGVEAFARLARETAAFEVVGPPLAISEEPPAH